MISLCILFLHHLDDQVTRHHYQLIKQTHSDIPIIPLTFNLGLTDAVKLNVPLPNQLRVEWRNVDKLIYYWFKYQRRIHAERYLILESDTHCNIPAKEFYSNVWDKPASGALVRTSKTHSRVWIFKEVENPTEYGTCLLAVTPISGILLSHDALSVVSDLADDPHYDLLFSEVRIGTLLAAVGFPPVPISPSIEEYISWKKRVPVSAGIWHSVKKVYPAPVGE